MANGKWHGNVSMFQVSSFEVGSFGNVKCGRRWKWGDASKKKGKKKKGGTGSIDATTSMVTAVTGSISTFASGLVV